MQSHYSKKSKQSKPTKRRNTGSRSAHAHSSCVFLIPLDASATRKKEIRRYKTRLQELERQRRIWTRFETEDAPGFGRWLEREFGSLLEKIRETDFLIRKMESLIEDVKLYAWYKKVSLRKAYQEIKKAQESGTAEALWKELNSFGAVGGEEERRDVFSDLFEQEEEEQEEDFFDPRNFKNLGEAPSQETTGNYLKMLYRQLARALHPDTKENQSESERNLWYEVQKAYSSGDAYRLQEILSSVSAGQPEIIDLKSIPIGDIINLRLHLENRLRQLRRDLAEARTQSPWNFSEILKNSRNLSNFKQKIAMSLSWEGGELMEQKIDLEKQIADWNKPFKKQTTQRKREKTRIEENESWRI